MHHQLLWNNMPILVKYDPYDYGYLAFASFLMDQIAIRPIGKVYHCCFHFVNVSIHTCPWYPNNHDIHHMPKTHVWLPTKDNKNYILNNHFLWTNHSMYLICAPPKYPIINFQIKTYCAILMMDIYTLNVKSYCSWFLYALAMIVFL